MALHRLRGPLGWLGTKEWVMTGHTGPDGPRRSLDTLAEHVRQVADAFEQVRSELDTAGQILRRATVEVRGGAELTGSVVEVVRLLERRLARLETAAGEAAVVARRHCGDPAPTPSPTGVPEQRTRS